MKPQRFLLCHGGDDICNESSGWDAYAAACSKERLDACRRWRPHIQQTVAGPEGWEFTAGYEGPEVRAEHVRRMRIHQDGEMSWFEARMGVRDRRDATLKVFEDAIAAKLTAMLRSAHRLYEAAGYVGQVDVGVAISNVEGAVSSLLEGLLSNVTQEVTRVVGDRAALLCADTPAEAVRTRELLRAVYRSRSRYVHGDEPPEGGSAGAANLARRAVVRWLAAAAVWAGRDLSARAMFDGWYGALDDALFVPALRKMLVDRPVAQLRSAVDVPLPG